MGPVSQLDEKDLMSYDTISGLFYVYTCALCFSKFGSDSMVPQQHTNMEEISHNSVYISQFKLSLG